MTVSEAIKARRSIRKFKQGEINADKIEKLLEAAMLAPSACNSRPWEFVVVQDRKKLDELMKAHPHAAMLKDAALAIIVCACPSKDNAMAAGFFQQDCAAATENILLEAVELGLGTCWCGVYPDQSRVEGVQKAAGISGIPFNVIAVGIPDESPPPRGKYEKSRVKFI